MIRRLFVHTSPVTLIAVIFQLKLNSCNAHQNITNHDILLIKPKIQVYKRFIAIRFNLTLSDGTKTPACKTRSRFSVKTTIRKQNQSINSGKNKPSSLVKLTSRLASLSTRRTVCITRHTFPNSLNEKHFSSDHISTSCARLFHVRACNWSLCKCTINNGYCSVFAVSRPICNCVILSQTRFARFFVSSR